MHVLDHDALRHIQVHMRKIPDCLDIASDEQLGRPDSALLRYGEHRDVNIIFPDKPLDLLDRKSVV